MALKAVRRMPTSQVQNRLGRIVEEVATTGEPVIVQKRGDDQAAIISLGDFRKLQPEEEAPPTSERERVRAALRAAGLLSEPTAQEVARVKAWEAEHPPEEQERILAELRSLRLDPPLSEIILRNRDPELG
jgi:prevent-host-death family protein